FAAACRMADKHRAVQIECLRQGSEIVGIGIEVVALPRLARTPVTAPIMRDTAITALGEEEHLVFERIGAQRPAMAEDDGLTRAPILVVDLGAVFGSDRAHR